MTADALPASRLRDRAQPNRLADAVCEALALSEAELSERAASLEVGLESYRELAMVAIAQLADLGAKHKALRAKYVRLIERNRVLREETMKPASATPGVAT
jgi:hypothetical protein